MIFDLIQFERETLLYFWGLQYRVDYFRGSVRLRPLSKFGTSPN